MHIFTRLSVRLLAGVFVELVCAKGHMICAELFSDIHGRVKKSHITQIHPESFSSPSNIYILFTYLNILWHKAVEYRGHDESNIDICSFPAANYQHEIT